MANFNSSNSSSTSTYGSCQARVTHMEELFYLCCLGPAILIVLVLAFLNKRISYKKQACNGQPGLVVPFDFFSGHKNRITIAMAFGATAGNVLIILFSTSTLDYLPGPPWVRGMDKILSLLSIKSKVKMTPVLVVSYLLSSSTPDYKIGNKIVCLVLLIACSAFGLEVRDTSTCLFLICLIKM